MIDRNIQKGDTAGSELGNVSIDANGEAIPPRLELLSASIQDLFEVAFGDDVPTKAGAVVGFARGQFNGVGCETVVAVCPRHTESWVQELITIEVCNCRR